MTHKAGRSDHGDQLALSGRPVRHTILNKSVPYFRALRSTTRLGESLRVEDAISEPCSDSHDMGKHPLDPAIGHLRVWHEQCSFANGPARGHLTWVRRRHKCATLTLSVRLRGSRPAAELSWALAKGSRGCNLRKSAQEARSGHGGDLREARAWPPAPHLAGRLRRLRLWPHAHAWGCGE